MPAKLLFVDRQRGILHVVSPDGTYEMFKSVYETKDDFKGLIDNLEVAVKDGRMDEYVVLSPAQPGMMTRIMPLLR